MKRTLNVLLTLAILASVVGLAYYVSEWLAEVTHANSPERDRYHDFGFDLSNYIKFIVYWTIGFVGFYVFGRVVKAPSFMKNALMIAFGYLLIIGSHGGWDFSGVYLLKIILSLLNTVIFCVAYRIFEKQHYPQ